VIAWVCTGRGALAAAGVRADVIELPARGIHGNTHMLMMDRNSDQTAAMIEDWMEKNGLMR
jgi:hypothetical protein